MNKLSKKQWIVVGAVFITLILAMFPTSDFISMPFRVDGHVKQQHFNEAGLFTVTPFTAAQYFADSQSGCYWIDTRDPKEFSESHLKVALNQSLKQLQNSTWNANDLILVYGDNTGQAQAAVAYLRQVKNARAFAVKGGFSAIKKYLMDPIGISVTNQFSDKDLTKLIEIRNKLSGQNVSPDQLLQKLKSSKSKTIREGC